MCFVNAAEITLDIRGWNELFPLGLPEFYTDTDSLIDIKASLPNIEKGCVKAFTQWATTRNAEIAQRRASYRTTGHFPLLNALLNQICRGMGGEGLPLGTNFDERKNQSQNSAGF